MRGGDTVGRFDAAVGKNMSISLPRASKAKKKIRASGGGKKIKNLFRVEHIFLVVFTENGNKLGKQLKE